MFITFNAIAIQNLFKQAMKSAFEYFLNINQKSTAEHLARYVDKKMRGEKGYTEQEVETKLDQVFQCHCLFVVASSHLGTSSAGDLHFQTFARKRYLRSILQEASRQATIIG